MASLPASKQRCLLALDLISALPAPEPCVFAHIVVAEVRRSLAAFRGDSGKALKLCLTVG